MKGYYTGITKFIERCDTPMTIAIQGDWGIGKTSAMENIQHMLKNNTKNPCIWFKTWQFSAVSNRGNILIEFMLTLLDKLEEHMRIICIADYLGAMSKRTFKDKKKIDKQLCDINKIILEAPWNTDELLNLIEYLWPNTNDKKDTLNEEIKKIIEIFKNEYCINVNEDIDLQDEKISVHKNILRNIEKNKKSLIKFGINFSAAALSTAAGFLPGGIAIAANAAIDYGKDKGLETLDKNSGIDEDFSAQHTNKSQTLFLVSISKEINRVIETILNHYDKSGNNKLCIFVDDLDRLQPAIALELLEGLKNFVEYERCVFILAVEKDVIYQGLRSKYDEGFLSEKTKNDSKRTRAEKYFDKIIQVPFEIPQKSYDLKEYMNHLLKTKGLNKDEESDSINPSVADYANVLKRLKICNPRCIKRCYNLQALYDSLSEAIPNLKEDSSVEKHKDWYDLCSFAVTVIQLENPDVYNAMMELVDDEIVVSGENSDSEGSSIDDFWKTVQEQANQLEYSDINVVISCFDKAKEKTGLEIRHWLPRILALTNYDDTFNKKRIYFKKLKRLIKAFETDNCSGLDFTEFKKHLDNLLETNSSNFEDYFEVKNNDIMFRIGWGNKERPYLIIKTEKAVGIDFSEFKSFIKYRNGNNFSDSDKNVYYIYTKEKPNEIALYISGELDISNDLKELFIKLGLLSK